jgi:arylsulfatase A-like enzyme
MRPASPIATAVVALVAVACGRELPAPRNVLVVLVDTLRADHLSLYGYGRPTSPHLDRRGRRATVFEQARSQAPCTFPSVNSILTSRYPIEFLGRGKGEHGIPAETPTWAEILAAHGFSTGAVSASFVVRDGRSAERPEGLFGRGFDRFDESCERRPADCVNARALAMLDELRPPFFLYLHYMEPHDPYGPPASFARRWSTGYRSELDFVNGGGMWRLKHALFGPEPAVPVRARDFEHLRDLYDEEVAYFDEELERLMGALESRALLDETLVVLLADHGEHLQFEHHQLQHCQSVWEEAIRTPLVVWRPGEREGRRIADPVQNVDALPTVLDLLGVAHERGAFRGRSLRRLLDGGRLPERPGFAHHDRWLTAFDRRHKLIVDLETGERRLFDLAADPGEHYDLSASRPDALERLSEALRAWAAAEGLSAEELRRRGDAAKATLRALGYL